MNLKTIPIFILVFLSAAGCASRKLVVQSNPSGADVYLSSQDRPATKVGQTPVDLDPKMYPDLYSSSAQIQVVKDHYGMQSVLVPSLESFGGIGRISANLSATELPKACTAQQESVNDIARGVAEIAGMIQKRRLNEASSLVESLIAKYDNVSTLYDLQGNIFYLQKNVERALASYKSSSRLTPNNSQTQHMIDRIQKMQGTGGEQ